MPLTKPVNYQTRNVVVVVVDGPRYSETWGDASHSLIPHMANDLAPVGIINTDFRNDGFTFTDPGHTAICTGYRENIDNGGHELPRNPSFLQYWLQAYGQLENKAWVITSKDKLNILSNTRSRAFKDKFMPRFNCGVNGPSSGYREDSTTFRIVKQVLKSDKPNLMLINFKQPDARGHAKDWEGYLNGIKQCDDYVWQLWQFLQSDPNYRDKTTLIVTNDHGRHLNGHSDGFISHGDGCEGCRHINFFAAGPDFKSNAIINTRYNQTDISATIAELMGFNMPSSDGQVMWDLFRNH